MPNTLINNIVKKVLSNNEMNRRKYQRKDNWKHNIKKKSGVKREKEA